MTISRENVEKALKACRGSSRGEILKKASKLDVKQRLDLIEFFQIEPQELSSKIIMFWSAVRRNISTFNESVGSFFTGG